MTLFFSLKEVLKISHIWRYVLGNKNKVYLFISVVQILVLKKKSGKMHSKLFPLLWLLNECVVCTHLVSYFISISKVFHFWYGKTAKLLQISTVLHRKSPPSLYQIKKNIMWYPLYFLLVVWWVKLEVSSFSEWILK